CRDEALLCKASLHAHREVTERLFNEGDCYRSDLDPRWAFGFVASSATSLRIASRAVCVAITASLHALPRSLADRTASSSFLSFRVLRRSRRTNSSSSCSSTNADKKSSTEIASLCELRPGSHNWRRK